MVNAVKVFTTLSHTFNITGDLQVPDDFVGGTLRDTHVVGYFTCGVARVVKKIVQNQPVISYECPVLGSHKKA